MRLEEVDPLTYESGPHCDFLATSHCGRVARLFDHGCSVPATRSGIGDGLVHLIEDLLLKGHPAVGQPPAIVELASGGRTTREACHRADDQDGCEHTVHLSMVAG